MTPLPMGGARKEIPKRAFQDPRFLDYISHLDHEPVLQDYITFKMAIIGDLIEEKYADKLNQAMDEVFMELVKKQFVSWHTFRHVSKRLLVEGKKIQDGIMLIPCFARQLMDYVPGFSSTIGQYTEQVLEKYAADNILGMGGWVSTCGWGRVLIFTCHDLMSSCHDLAFSQPGNIEDCYIPISLEPSTLGRATNCRTCH
jgi:hypothetical protein